MTVQDRETGGISYAMSEPSLREKAPSCLQRAGPLRSQFSIANDREAKQPETGSHEVRTSEEPQRGSQMVKRHKPFLELKPSYANQVKRSLFNQDWIRLQRAEKNHQFRTQRQVAPQQRRLSEPVLER